MSSVSRRVLHRPLSNHSQHLNHTLNHLHRPWLIEAALQ
jgi:hypothetical protein